MTDRELPYNTDVFEPATKTGRKIRCKICRAEGWPDIVSVYGNDIEVGNPWWWGNPHLRAHGWDCSDCDRAFTTSYGLSAHRRSAHR